MKRYRGLCIMSITTLVVLVFAAAGCNTSPSSSRPQHAVFAAEGVFVRHVRLRLDPAHTQSFEALIARCVVAAQTAELPADYEWMCYRESPGRYWLLTMSETEEGFAIPARRDPLMSFARQLASAAGGDAVREVDAMLEGLDYRIEWQLLFRQKQAWSTVDGMSTTTHPKARMMLRRIRPGKAEDFDLALTARTTFLQEHGYPLPIEGFASVMGPPGIQFQVVFPVDWPSFYSRDSFGAFIENLDANAQAAYAELKAALMQCMDLAEYYDGDFLAELSYELN